MDLDVPAGASSRAPVIPGLGQQQRLQQLTGLQLRLGDVRVGAEPENLGRGKEGGVVLAASLCVYRTHRRLLAAVLGCLGSCVVEPQPGANVSGLKSGPRGTKLARKCTACGGIQEFVFRGLGRLRAPFSKPSQPISKGALLAGS